MNIEIANRLVELRKSHALSQEDLAARMGVSRQAVSKWERAESSPDTDNLIALARLYGVSLDELLLHHVEELGGVAAQTAPQYVSKPTFEEDEDAEILAAAAQWDAADAAAQQKSRSGLKKALLIFPYPVFLVICYLALGFTLGWWHPSWMLFLTIPIYYGLAGAL